MVETLARFTHRSPIFGELDRLEEALPELEEGWPALVRVDGRCFVLTPARAAGRSTIRRLVDLPLVPTVPVPHDLSPGRALSEMVQAGAQYVPVAENGEVVGVVARADLCEHARLHDGLATLPPWITEDLLRTLGAIRDGFVLLDDAYTIVLANERGRELLARAGAPLSGRLAALGGVPISELRKRARTAAQQITVKGADRRRRYTARVLATRPEEHAGTVLVLADVTEEHRGALREQRSANASELARLAAGIGHDFNNLLSVVLGYTETLAQGLDEHSEQKRAANQILRTCDRASQLVRELRMLGESEPVRLVELDVDELLRSMQDTLTMLTRPNVQLEVQIEGGLRRVLADALLIERVVLNLAKNSVHAMPNGGLLTLRARNLSNAEVGPELPLPVHPSCDEWVELAVIDTGTGMDEATSARAFEPYFTTRPGSGTGLGLATVRTIVHRLGGNVRVESNPSAGTTMRVMLRAAPSLASR